MDSKKRIRGDEGSELDPTEAKRMKAANGQALHHSPTYTAKASASISSAAIDALLMDMDDSEMLPVEPTPTPIASSSTPRHAILPSPTIVKATSRPSASALEELLDGLGDDEAETEQVSVSQANARPAPPQALPSSSTSIFTSPTTTTTKPASNTYSGVFSKSSGHVSLHTAPVSSASHATAYEPALQYSVAPDPLQALIREEPIVSEPAQLFQSAAKSFVPQTPLAAPASEDAMPELIPSPEDDDVFEAILAAARAKKDHRTTRQLHKPVVAPTSTIITPSSAASASSNPAPSAPQESLKTQDIASSNLSISDEPDDDFEKALASIKAKNAAPRTFNAPVRLVSAPRANHLGSPSPAPPNTSLFQSARSIPSSNGTEAAERAPPSEPSSLFQSASRELSTGSPAPLFSSARKLQSEDQSPSAGSSSLFTPARNLPTSDEAPNGSLFQTASREHSSPAPSSSSLFSSARSIRDEESGGTSLFSSARSLQNEPTGSLFQAASRESLPAPLPSSTSKSSSLFSSARSIRDESAAPAASSGSLFSSARHLDADEGSASLFQVASRDVANGSSSTSLFSSARNLREDSGTQNKIVADNSPTASAPATTADDDDFEHYMANLSAKKSAATFSAPRALNSTSPQVSSRPASSSLFQPANSLGSTTHQRQDGVAHSAPQSASIDDEEDEFEAFLKTVSKRSAAAPATASSKKTGSTTTSNASSKAKAASSAPASAPNPRKFKAPAVISPTANRNSTSKMDEDKKDDDEDTQDALLSLLDGDDSDDEQSAPLSTPEPSSSLNSLPKSPVVLRAHTRPMPAPTSVRPPLHDSSSESVPTVTSPLPTEAYADLLEGLESEEMSFNPPSTPQPSNASRRFYASPSSKTPSTPTSSGSSRPGISNRGVVRSSPYSLTSPNAMPIVVSTPNKLVEVRSPSRLPRSTPSPIPSATPSTKRARAPFTSPTKVAEDGGEGDDNLAKRSKQVVYGRSAAGDAAPKQSVKAVENHLFNLTPTEEQLAARKPWSAIGRAPHGFSRQQLLAYKLRPQVVDMTSDTAKTFKFSQMDADGEMRQLGAEDMFQVLLSEGASRKVLTLPWVENHYRWIVWKLASVERSFPQDFANAYLTPERVLAQLKYRYERELNCAQRPPLRKILEHDAPAAVHLVLTVSAVRHDGTADKSVRITGDDGPQTYNEEEESNRLVKGPLAILELSDGWYSVHALCDPYLTYQVQDGAIFAGQKLHVFGASIIGNDNPTPPLEVTASTMLKLSINGVRRAKWDDKLGFSRIALPSLRLSSLKPGGGNAPKIDAIILRVYPLTFSEEVIVTPTEDAPKGPDGEANPVMRVVRTPFGEDIALERFIKKKEDWIERKTREITMEILEESKSNGAKASARMDVDGDTDQTGASNGGTSHYYDESYLTNSQREKLEERLREAMEVEPWLDRQITPVLKLLICDFPGTKGPAYEVIEYLKENGADGLMTLTAAQNKALHSLGKAMLTVYNVTEDALARFKEGTRIQASFISYKGEPFVPPRPLPNMSLNSQSDANPNGFTNITSADDPFALSDTATEVVVAPLPRLTTTVYTIFNFPTTTRSRNTEESLSLMDPRASSGDSVVKTLNALFGRVATPFDALDARLKLKEVPVPENTWDLDALLDYERRRLVDRFTIANEFDGVGVVVFAGKKEIIKKCKYAQEEDLNALKDEYQLDIFLGDPTGNLLALRAESILDNLPPAAFEIGAILCFKNVNYNGFDSHVGVHSASSTEYTEWITKAPSATANPSLKAKRDALLEWTHTNDFVETMELLSSRIIDIRTNRAARALPIANASSAIYIKS